MVRTISFRSCLVLSSFLFVFLNLSFISISNFIAGQFGCGLCYHPGYRMKFGRGHCRSYSIFARDFPCRTHDDTVNRARDAEATGQRQQGIKGHSILTQIPGFNIVECLDLDLFHALVNCSKRFTNLWLNSKYCGKRFNVNSRFHEVNRRLMSITPTDSVSRVPRSLEERTDWRGHEWFYWVIFYSIPVLTGILPVQCLNHWSLLVHGLVLLMQNSTSKADVVYAGRYFKQFNSEIDSLYGPEHVTFSTHLLTHLERSTKNFAQPWTHSAFIFENFLGEIKAIIKSSNGMAQQIIKHMQLRIALRVMRSDLDYAMSASEKGFFTSVMHSSKVLADPQMIVAGVSFLGEPKTVVLSPNLQEVLERGGFHPAFGVEYSIFDRCLVNNVVFQSVNYTKTVKQNNSIVLLESSLAFEIHSFIVIDNEPVALGHYLIENRARLGNGSLPHMKTYNDKCEENLRCVSVLNFDDKLLSFSLEFPQQTVRIACINVLEMEMLH